MDHSFAVDYFALGVIAYEFMMGKVIVSINSETLYRSKQEGDQRKDFGETSSIG